MKVLMVNPLHHPHSMNFLHCLDLVGVKYSHMPLSLPTLAALTPRDWTVRIIDENVEPLDMGTEADLVVITGSVPQRERVFELCEGFRRRGRTVLLGGPITFDMLEDCKRHADVVFVGEAEYTWPAYIADYQKGATRPLYHQKEWVDMAHSPVPRFDLLRNDMYASGCIQATRGCPYKCDFCDIPIKYGSYPRSKQIPQVIEEIKALSALGHDSVFVVDDNFAGNRAYAKKLLAAIAEVLPTLPTRMYFYTQATLDVAEDEELLGLFRQAAFLRLFIGIETGDRERLRELNKRHQVEMDIKRAVDKIKSYGITVWAGIMFGLENDDLASFDRQLKFIIETDIIPVQVGLLQAVPGTALYARAQATNRLIVLPSLYGITALSEEDIHETTNLRPAHMSKDELGTRFASTLRAMFSPEAYTMKMSQYIGTNTRGLGRSMPALNMKTVRILKRMVGYYLFRADAGSRKMFFKVLWQLLVHRLRNLDETVFHLLAYKHIRTHYYRLAEICESAK